MGAATQQAPSAKAEKKLPLLEVRDLHVHFPYRRGPLWRRETGVVRAVDGVSFSIEAGKTFGLVGESGCGKSTTARAILRLIQPTSGDIRYYGRSISRMNDRELLSLRRDMQMIFQDPYGSLNPRMTVGRIISEPMKIFGLHDRHRRQLETLRLMDMVGLNPKFFNRYPHEFSGGQRQRIGIARALAVNPQLIVCDEPVSALDVSIQAQIVNLLKELQRELNIAYLFIAHDLAVVRHMSDYIGVMHKGRIVETAPADELYTNPKHEYTRTLLAAVPVADPIVERQKTKLAAEGDRIV